MKTFVDASQDETTPRTHPWTVGIHDPRAKFTDFRKHPELIPTALEEFVPHARFPAIQQFYEFVRWLNGETSVFETTDATFRGPATGHNSAQFPQFKLMCSGRLVLFCRHYEIQIRYADWIAKQAQRVLRQHQPDSANACVGTFKFATQFPALSDDGGQTAPVADALGFRFFGFGNTDDEAFEGFGLAVAGAFAAIREVDEMLVAGYNLKP